MGRRQWVRGGFCLFQVLLDRLQCFFSSFRPGWSALSSGQHPHLLTLGSLLWSKTRNWASQMEVGWGIPFWKAAWLKILNLQRERSTLLVDGRAPIRGSWPHRSEDLREIGSRLETPGLILWWAFFPQSWRPCSDSVSPKPPVKGFPPRLPSHAGWQY